MIDEATFQIYVREVFARLDDTPFVQRHSLAMLLARGERPGSAERLRHVLLAAVEKLRPPSSTPSGTTTDRRYRCLSLRYVEGLNTKQIARRLQVSERQVQRDYLAGVDAVAELLWAEQRPSAPPLERQTSSRASEVDLGADLGVELARISTLSPNQPSDLGEVLSGVLTTTRDLVKARQAEVRVDIASDLVRVPISQSVLRQVFLCLVTAMLQDKESPEVNLVVENTPVGVRVTLSSPAPAPRSDATPFPSSESAALLKMARDLAEAEGGTLTVTADSHSHRVTLTLPTSRSATVLVVDDNPDIAQLFRWYLAGSNYRLVTARTPPTALELAHDLHPDAIILDVMLPLLDGWQILERLRGAPDTRDIPVIVCSILPERALAESLGVNGFLAKPVTPEALRSALEQCLAPRPPAERRGSPEAIG